MPSTPDEVIQWTHLDQMVMGWLLVSLSPEVLAQVVDQKTSRECWLALEHMYDTATRSCIQQLKTELQTLQKGSKTIHEHLQTAKSLSLALASAGKAVDDEDLILWISRGLGSEYDPLVAAINTQTVCPSYAAVSGILLDFELRLTPLIATPPSAFTATSARTYGPSTPSSPAFSSPSDNNRTPPSSRRHDSRGRGGGRGRGRGHGGDRGGGRGRSSLTSGSSSMPPSSSNVVCYRCGHPYHKANHCWAPDDVVDSSSKA